MDTNLVITLISILLASLLLIGLVLIMRKKFFSRKNKTVKLNRKYDSEAISYKDKLEQENRRLNLRISFLEEKSKLFESKTTKLTTANEDLEKQKTQLLESKKRLEELQTQKDDLFAMVVHDIKNPASAMKGFIELLESYDLTAKDQQEIMAGILNTSTRILKLAEEAAKVMSRDSKLIELELRPSQINDIADTIFNRYKSVATKKGISLSLNKSDKIPETDMDPDKIEEALDNFVSNAIKFAPPETTVEIKSRKEENKIVVEVIDNGYGITKEELELAFEKGAELSNKPTGDESSTGLGLWIVKRIIEEHKGRVWVKSKPGAGSTFAFQIPIKTDE